MPVASLASLCHHKIVCQHLKDDPHILLEENVLLIAAKMASTGNQLHMETCEDLLTRQATRQFWVMSDNKLKVMSVCQCGRCGRSYLANKIFPWARLCQNGHNVFKPY